MGIPIGKPTANFDLSPDDGNANSPIYLALGPKDGGKSSNLVTIPKAEGTKHIYLSGDRLTRAGVEGFIHKAGLDLKYGRDYEVYTLGKHYKPGRLETAEVTKRYVEAVLGKVEEAAENGEVACVFLEHYEAMLKKMATDYMRHECGLAPGTLPEGKNGAKQWGKRGEFMNMLDSFIERVQSDATFVVGYDTERQMLIEKDPDTGKVKSMEYSDEPPRWMTSRESLIREIEATFLLGFDGKVMTLGDGTKAIDTKYHATVIGGKGTPFEPGQSWDTTNRGLSVAFDNDWWIQRIARRVVA